MKINCPTCQKQITYDSKNPYRPFCSKRCQLIDLGEWADEKHTIPEQGSEKVVLDPEDIEAMLAQQPDDFFK